MKISRFLIVVTLVTFFALFYVWQQAEIFRLAYEGQKSFACLQDLADTHNLLKYNIERKASLIQIGNKVSEAAEYYMPDTYKLVKVNLPREAVKVGANKAKKETLFSRVFGIKRQAEAETLDR